MVLGLLFFPRFAQCQTAIACGQTIAGATTTPSQVDQYGYAGRAGQVISVSLWSSLSANGNFYPMVAEIYNPSGQFLMTLSDSDYWP